MDFDDLLVCAVRLLAEHPHYLELYRRRWRWIVVDEYQDTCQAQAVLVSLLAGPDGNLCCVADDDQSLYSFRGADAHGLARLAERFPAHERIVLARNFRSRAEILSPAARCIQNNPDRVPKTLIAMRGPGGHAAAVAFASERDEASWIAVDDRPGARGGHTARGDPAARPHRLRDRARADRAGGRRHPAPGARLARPV